LFESAALTPLDFSLWGWMKSKINRRNLNTRDEFLVAFLTLLFVETNMKINSNEQHAIFANEWQSTLSEVDFEILENLL
jgi:hypothetical protein